MESTSQVTSVNTRLALKEGEKLTLKIGGDRRERSPHADIAKMRSPTLGSGAFAISPPSTRLSRENSKSAGDLPQEEEWGDFVAST